MFLVTGLLGGLAALAWQPAPAPRAVEAAPAAPTPVPVFLIDRTPHPEAEAPKSVIVDRNPPDYCFAPRSKASARQALACG
jgi:hypothetical protein